MSEDEPVEKTGTAEALGLTQDEVNYFNNMT